MTRIPRSWAGIVVMLGLLAGCGGGGGGGGSSAFSYDGVTSQAALTRDNSQEFVDATVDGTSGTDAFITRASNAGTGGSTGGVDLITLGRILKNSAGRLDGGAVAGRAVTSAIQSASDSEFGPCGGRVEFNVTFDDQTGDFNGSIAYFAYCDRGVVINGRAGFSGVLDPAALTLEGFTLDIEILSVSAGGKSLDLSGSVSIDVSAPNVGTVSYTLNFRTGGKTYRIQNFTVQVDESVIPALVDIGGRLYHPDHGYVIVSTPTSIETSVDGTPISGMLVFTGANSSATVTFVTDNDYTIAVDEDGDSVPDVTRNCTWSPHVCT